MIESKCSNCGTVFQVPKPGKYLCYACNNTVIVKKSPPLTSPVLDIEDSPEAEDSGLNYDLVTHSFKGKRGSFLKTSSIEGDEQAFAQSSIPWENRKKIGFFRAFFQTIKEAITNPKKLFSTASADKKNVNSAWGFAILVSLLCLIIRNLILNIFVGSPIIPIDSSSHLFYGSFGVVFYFLEFLIGMIIAIVVVGALLNLGAIIMGEKTSSGVGQLVICYAFSANVFTIIPIGIFAGLIMVACTVYICSEGLIKFYKMKRVKAVIAAFVPQIMVYLLVYIIFRSIYRF
jgi:hypothetical protein